MNNCLGTAWERTCASGRASTSGRQLCSKCVFSQRQAVRHAGPKARKAPQRVVLCAASNPEPSEGAEGSEASHLTPWRHPELDEQLDSASSNSDYSSSSSGSQEPDKVPGSYLDYVGRDAQVLADRMARLRALEEYRELLADYRDAVAAKKQLGARGSDEDAGQQLDLFRCALLIAKHAYPQLEEARWYEELAAIAAMVEAALEGQPRYPLKVVRAINSVMYDKLGYCGANQGNYYEADNSCINTVMERRTGIPITLSLMYMEVARRVGLKLAGLNLPGHFMLMVLGEDMECLIDAFQRGEVCYIDDAEEVLSGVLGATVKLDPDWVKPDSAISPIDFLMRMLNNLKHIYITTNRVEEALAIIRYMRATDPSHAVNIRDEALCLYRVQRYAECLEALREYMEAGAPLDQRELGMLSALMLRVQELMKEPGGAAGGNSDTA